ncbi:hypothetical protein ACJ41O_012784 [Fusarium nematophilum]
MVDQLNPPGDDAYLHPGIDEELAHRYLILAYNSIQGIKGRIQGSGALRQICRGGGTAEFSDLVSLLHRWHDQKIGCLEMRLSAMRMLPFFFAALPSDGFHDIDGTYMAECLRNLTISTQLATIDHTECDPGWVWMEGSASRLLHATVSSHLTSLFEANGNIVSDCPKLPTSWIGISIASGLYLHSVLDIWSTSGPIEPRLLRRFLTMLMRDLDRDAYNMSAIPARASTEVRLKKRAKKIIAIMHRIPGIPRIHLLCLYETFVGAFNEAAEAHGLPSSITVSTHNCLLGDLPSSTQFDTVVSPANSYGRLDGGFDGAISQAFSPTDDYLALTRAAQEKLYDEYRGFAPPGTCTILRIPEGFHRRSRNVWGAKYLALCPTMRVPMDVRWDREVVYNSVWSLLCAVDKHNRSATEEGDMILSMLMTPLATGTGFVSAERWANQTVLALKHFSEALEDPDKWRSLDWPDIFDAVDKVGDTWKVEKEPECDSDESS